MCEFRVSFFHAKHSHLFSSCIVLGTGSLNAIWSVITPDVLIAIEIRRVRCPSYLAIKFGKLIPYLSCL